MSERSRPDDDNSQPGPLGWFELALDLVRDRSRSSWMLLRDEELLEVVRRRSLVAAYLPGELVATPDLVNLRVAVSPDGKVAVAPDGGPPQPGEHLDDVIPGLLEELKTVALILPDNPVGPPWLPVEEIIGEALKPGQDTRQVYCYRGEDTVAATAFARDLDEPLTVYQEDGWVVAATGHGPARVMTGPPRRITRAYPFALLARRGLRREFAYVEAPKDDVLNVHAEWSPQPRSIELPDAHPDTTELLEWLAERRSWETRARAEGRIDPEPDPDLPPGMTDEQHQTLERWMSEPTDAAGFLPETAASFRIPAVAAQLVEAAPGTPDPEGGRTITPARGVDFMASALADQDTEPEGRAPWTVLERAVWRRPALGVAIGAVLVLLCVALAALQLTGTWGGWWTWLLVPLLALAGLVYLASALLRMRSRR